MLLSLNYK